MKKRMLLAIGIACTLRVLAIQQIRWGSSGDPLNGLTITWRNNGSADSIRWGYTASYEKGAFAGKKRNGYADNFFNYTFPTVNPRSTIYYKLYDSNTKTWNANKTFATASSSNTTNFSFCVLGDSRDGLSVWKQVAALANAKKTDLALYNGDIVANAGSASLWDQWFNNGTAYLENNIIYHALGNHDAMSVPTYQNNFELPKTNGSNLYYSFVYGNALFITLNSENPGDAAQTSWLINTLSAAKSNDKIIWKIISFHKPFYTIGTHAGEMNSYFGTWWKAFDDYGVDLIVNGHDHMYERTKPINRNVSTTSPVATYGSGTGQGRCQIVCGGAGAPLYSGSPTWAIQKYKSSYNFCKFSINGSTLCDTTYDNNGNIIDQFCIDKTSLATEIPEVSNNKDVEVFNKIQIMPNPIETTFKLNYFSTLNGEALIRIFDMSGREILSQKVMKDSEKLEFSYDLSEYARGAYTIEVIVGDKKDSALIILK
jgi:hypothetical protein